MPPKKQTFRPLIDPNPKNWFEAADALKSLPQPKKPKTGPTLEDRLASIEQALKAKQDDNASN